MYRKHTYLDLCKASQLEVCEEPASDDPRVALELAVDQYIVKVYHYEFIDKWLKQLSHHPMEVLGALDSPKGITIIHTTRP